MSNLDSTKEGVSVEQDHVLKKMFCNLPKKVGNSGNSGMSLEEGLRLRSDSVPHNISKRGPRVMKALLVPDSEKHSVQGESQPLIFGKDSLMSLIINGMKGEKLSINVGMSASSEISPMFPAYLEIAIQRLKELIDVGISARLRFFSTASLSPILNGGNKDQVQDMQQIQRQLIERYVESFYEDLEGLVCANDIEQEMELMDEEELLRRVEVIREGVSGLVLGRLEACGAHHGGSEGQENALVYAAYHSRSDAFQDEGEAENIISVGGPGESLFNEVRFQVFNDLKKTNIGIVVPSALISRTPPYLKIPNGIGMEEFVEGKSSRIQSFWDKPKAKKHRIDAPGSRDLLYVGRCLGEKQNILDGLSRLREFYRDNQEIL